MDFWKTNKDILFSVNCNIVDPAHIIRRCYESKLGPVLICQTRLALLIFLNFLKSCHFVVYNTRELTKRALDARGLLLIINLSFAYWDTRTTWARPYTHLYLLPL